MHNGPTASGGTAESRFVGRALVVLVGALLLLVLGGCGEDGPLSDVTITTADEGGGEAPEETAPPAETAPPEQTAPPETAPPEQTAPPETAPPDESTGDEGVSGQTIALIAILGGLAVVAILSVTNIMSSRAQSKDAERADRRTRLAEIIGGFRWVHDQGSMEIMRTTDPDQLRRSWQMTNSRMVELEGTASAMTVETNEPDVTNAFNDLGRASAGLRAALEADVSLRSNPANLARDDLVLQSSQTVQQRRLELNAALSNPALRMQ